MPNRVAAAIIGLGILAFAACGGGDAATTPTVRAFPTLVPPTTVNESGTATPTTTRAASSTGVRVVDDAVTAVAAKDAAKLTALLHFWPKACTEPQGIGALPCPAGAPIGTPVNIVGIGSCEGSWSRPGETEIGTRNFVDRATRVYAVLKAPTSANQPEIPGKYQVIFEPGMVLSIDDQGITYLSFFCGGTPAQVITSGRFGANPEYLLKP